MNSSRDAEKPDKTDKAIRALGDLKRRNVRGHVFLWLEPGKTESRIESFELATRE